MRMNKKEKTALVPKLRFPEFQSTGEWEKYSLIEVAERISEKVGDKSLTTLSISAGVGFVSQAEKFSRDISGKQYENYVYLKKGDFSYNKGNSKKFPQGCIYELKEFEEAAVPNAFISFHFNDEYVPSFYKGYFDNNFHGKQLARFITSGARSDGLLNISPLNFFSIVLPTPKEKAEQQKIAECLSYLDDLISAEDKRLGALKAHKKGLMQTLFPAEGKTVPDWRFPEFRDSGEWETSTLDFLAVKITEKNNDKSLSRVFTNSAVNGVIDQQDFFDKDIANRSNLANYYVLDEGDYVYNPRISVTAPVGPISRNNVGKGVISPLYTVFRFKNKSNDYFEHFFKTTCWHQFLKNISNTGARHDRMSISSDGFMNMPLTYPVSKKEQQKIADCLSNLDHFITAQAEKIEALKAHKKGLMQGLFPSIEEVAE